VVDSGSVAVNDSEFAETIAASAVFTYGQATLVVSDSIFHDLAGTAIFAMGGAKVKVEGCGLGRIGASAIVAKDDPVVDISGTLFKYVRGSGAIFANAGPVTVTECQFSFCENSGIEVTQLQSECPPGATIAGCVFDNNKNAGILATAGKLTITTCDFLKNALTGVEIRGAVDFTIEDVYFDSNAGGGLALAASVNGDIKRVGIAGSQEFGIAIRDSSDVRLSELSVRTGSSPGIYIGDGSKAELRKVAIDGTDGVAILVSQTVVQEVSLNEVNINESGVGLQIAGGSKVSLAGGKFVKNGVHIDVLQNATIAASGALFTQSRDGVGVVVEPGSEGSFMQCEFSGETKAGIAIGGIGNLTEVSVDGCQLAGVYWYGNASGIIRQSTIRNNEQCGVVIMDGRAKLEGNTIDGHTIYGVHVNTGLSSKVEITDDNVFTQNTMANINYEN
jgi:hypothetical protein